MKKTLLFVAAMTASLVSVAQTRLTKDNIDQVIASMTLEEKATLLVGGSQPLPDSSIPTATSAKVPGAAGNTRAIPRFGIPVTVLSDGPAGVRIQPTRQGDSNTYYCTAFPVGTSMASSWDLDLMERVTVAMGQEVLEYGVDVLLAPGMNIHRSPLCGRNFEYFSEDPLLSGKMAAAYTKGIQSNGVGVSIKHFMANNQETNRNEDDAQISQRALREIYLKNFEIAVKEAQPWTVMSSYNKMNGKYTQQNRELLTTVLRDEWGFNGIVMTDWGNKAGTVIAVEAGNDLMCPGSPSEIQRIMDAVKNGTLSMEYVDTNVRRMLEYVLKTPAYANYKYSNKPDLKAHAALVREAGAECIVLLKNDGVLPLKGDENIALYGLGSYDFIAGGTGSGDVNKEYIRNIEDGLKGNGFKVNANIADLYSKYNSYAKALQVATGNGGSWFSRALVSEMEVPESVVARELPNSDIAVITIRRNSGEGADRTSAQGDFNLTAVERNLLECACDSYHAAGKKVVVVLNVGGVVETASWKNLPDAVVLAWQPGMEGGASVADVLCGKVNPSGKLPMSFPVSFFDTPSAVNFPYKVENNNNRRGPAVPRKNVDYTEYQEGIYVGYRYYETEGVEVSYPFGYGLSYTTFSYTKPVVKATADGFVATVTVTNTGKVAGKEAVQLYVSAPAGGLDKPATELKGFAKTKLLAPGESQVVTIAVDNYTLASFNEADSAWEAAAGTYKINFAASVKDVRASAEYKLKAAKNWKVNNVLKPEVALAK